MNALRTLLCDLLHEGWMYAGGSHKTCRTCFRRVMAPHHIATEPQPQQPADARPVEAQSA